MSILPKQVIRTTSPLRSTAIIGLLCLCILALGYYCWHLIQQQTVQAQMLTQHAAQQKQLEQSQSLQQVQAEQQLGDQQQQLSQTAASAKQKSQALAIQEATNEQLENQLGSLQDQVLDLEKELSFYQAVSHTSTTGGLKIHEFKLFVDNPAEPDQLRYRLILTQGKRIESPLEGNVMLELAATENNPLPTLLTETDFKLRYVQVIEGYFTLETGATPDSIAVILSQEGEPSRRQSFAWQLTPI
jgi:hypothetical protein